MLNDRELSVDRVYLSGGGARLRGFGGYLESALKTSTGIALSSPCPRRCSITS